VHVLLLPGLLVGRTLVEALAGPAQTHVHGARDVAVTCRPLTAPPAGARRRRRRPAGPESSSARKTEMVDMAGRCRFDRARRRWRHPGSLLAASSQVDTQRRCNDDEDETGPSEQGRACHGGGLGHCVSRGRGS
jgi:hypothetical protein